MDSRLADKKDKEEYLKVDIEAVKLAISDNEKTMENLKKAFRKSSKIEFLNHNILRRLKQANGKLKYFIRQRNRRVGKWEH